ncbi:MAG: right-handed parallel beta-helix repeat-containing protein [Planctomycetota bacterium]|nr:right-handed parallel beta-helix repeat-containing protein [Planctomycetota bacterium]
MTKLACLCLPAVTLATLLLCISDTALHAQGLTLYVSPHGNDAWSGKLAEPKDNDGPFASIVRARDAIRQGKVAQGGLQEPVTVRIRGGRYVLPEPISFTPEDSGTPQGPISYEAFSGEQPVLCGGKMITGWQPYQGKILVATLPEVQAGKWYFRSLFANGRRQIRARCPNVDPADPYRQGFLYADRDIQGFGLAVGNIHNPGDWMEYKVEVPADGEYAFWMYYGALNGPFGRADMNERTVLIVDGGVPVPLVNLPDTESWGTLRWSRAAAVRLTQGEHLLKWQNVKGGGLTFAAFALTDDSAWKPVGTALAKPAADKHAVVIQAANYVRSQGKQLSVSGTSAGSPTEFHYTAGTFNPSWAATGEAEIHVFQSSSCRAFKEIVSLVKVDDKTRRITIGGKECVTPILPGDRYFVENVLEELDSPGEWYLNRQTGQLFYWPLAEFSAKTEVVVPVLGRIVQILGDAAAKHPVSHLRFSGLTLQETDYSPADGCEGYGMGNDGVIYLKDATQCTIENCTFRNIGKYAVCLSGGRANAINGNDISHGAEGGVLLLKTAGNTVSDNHVHDCGFVYKHIGGVILEDAGTDDNLVAHNLIHDISRYGISLKNVGVRNRIEYNRVLNTSLETCDTGGIEVTQQDRELRSGSVIRNNIVGDSIGYSADGPKSVFMSWGIYLDSFAGGYTVTHNVTYRSSHGGMMLQGGKDNRIENNIFVDSAYSQLYISNFANNSTGQVFQRNIVSYTNPAAVLLTGGRLDENVIRIDRNLYFHAGGKDPVLGGCASFADWQKRGFDQNSVIGDPLFVDPARDNYTLRPDSPAWKLGFEPIDTSRVGLLRDRCRCLIRPAAPAYGLVGTRASEPKKEVK